MSESNKNEKVKEEENGKEILYKFYYELDEVIKGIKNPTSEKIFTENLNMSTISQLVNYIRESIQIIISKKVAEALKSQKPKNSELNCYDALEHQVIKLERKERKLMKTIFQYKLQKESLKLQLDDYMEMEDEFEEMKTKLHYQEGYFLQNDRKENEIIILRRENSNLKNALEENQKSFEDKLIKKDKEILTLKEQNNNLQLQLEQKKKEHNNLNITINSNEVPLSSFKRSVNRIGFIDKLMTQRGNESITIFSNINISNPTNNSIINDKKSPHNKLYHFESNFMNIMPSKKLTKRNDSIEEMNKAELCSIINLKKIINNTSKVINLKLRKFNSSTSQKNVANVHSYFPLIKKRDDMNVTKFLKGNFSNKNIKNNSIISFFHRFSQEHTGYKDIKE